MKNLLLALKDGWPELLYAVACGLVIAWCIEYIHDLERQIDGLTRGPHA